MSDNLDDYDDAMAQFVADSNGAAENAAADHLSIVHRGESPHQAELTAKPFVLRDPSEIPPRDWVYGRHLIRKFISCTVGGGGIGKTSLLLVEALSMVTRKPLLGIEVSKPLKVWVFNLEDPHVEIERRISAICLHYGITQDDIADRLFVNSGRDEPLVLAKQVGHQTIITPMADALTRQIIERNIDVLQIDPFIASHEVQENDNNAIGAVAKRWAQIANDGNCAIDLSHHVRKSGGNAATVEDARGAGALVNASRRSRRLVRMTTEEAENAGVDLKEMWRYSREGDSKENLAPPDRTHTWRKLESVDLGQGDNIGVQTPWKWPDAFEDVTKADLRAIQQKVSQGRYKANAQAKEWVGNAVADVLELDPTDKAAKKKITALLAEWIKNGMFEEFDDMDENRRETKKYIRIGKSVDAPPV